jgi:tetratricopeptide (TPR) repeat protein
MKKFTTLTTLFLISVAILSIEIMAQTSERLQAENLFIQAQKYLSQGEEEKAEESLKMALEENPDFTSAIWQLAQIYKKKGKLEHARELMLRGLEQNPNASWARNELSQIEKSLSQNLLLESERHMAEGEYEKAIPKLSLYMGINPYEAIPLIQMSRCHLALGNLKSSRWYLQQAVERDPTNEEITTLLNEVNRRISENSVEALEEKARRILANYTADKEDSARKALQAVLNKDSNNTWALEKLKELDLITFGEGEQDKPELKAKSMEKLGKITERLTSKKNEIIKWAGLILLVAIGALLSFDIKKRRSSGSSPLQGSLNFMPILDLTSLLNSNLKTGRMQIDSEEGRGEIFFEKGEIIHARFKTEGGKKAFHKIMNLESGNYKFSNHLPKVRHTISEPLSLLLLSMRSNDNVTDPSNNNKTRDKDMVPTH